MNRWDVVVVGGGHAGIEAASASARMGRTTLLVTMHLDFIGQMSCNPSVGGIGKGHIVAEIEAMDGAMGKLADRSGLQFKMLNTRKGYAVQALRVQCDRYRYRTEARRYLESLESLTLRQGEVVDLQFDGDRVSSLVLHDGTRIEGLAFVLTTGTFLSGKLHIGTNAFEGGRGGERSANSLSSRFTDGLGLSIGRLKTGTPPRLRGSTIDFSCMTLQPGDEPIPFYAMDFPSHSLFFEGPQIPCHLTSTTERTRDVIRKNLDRSPLYSGRIRGIGPRYCPSIEDKIVKFPDRTSHQVFLEPEGLGVDEFYPNGISTSLPVDVQEDIIHSIPGLENAWITRPGYAVEYDFVFPDQLDHGLRLKTIRNLFLAGQINGTTGYEEAAGQGLVAGVNAAFVTENRDPWHPDRSNSYIGVMIDDLVTQGVDEPYRMFTSRAENRLYIRYHNADDRLTPLGRRLGMVSDAQWTRYERKRAELDRLHVLVQKQRHEGSSLHQWLKRPDATFEGLLNIPLPDGLDAWPDAWKISFESEVKYEGYIRISKEKNERTIHDYIIPPGLFESPIPGISREILGRLKKASPRSLMEVYGVRGITAGALDALETCLRKESLKRS